jgi:subtilisin
LARDLSRTFHASRATQDADWPGARRPSGATGAGAKTQRLPKYRLYENLGIMLGTVDRNGLHELRGHGSVRKVVSAVPISLIRPTQEAAAAPLAEGPTWALKRLGIPELWDRGYAGLGVLVGHLDTGVDASHPALEGAIRAYAEFDDLGNPVTGAEPRDSDRHGTHTAGTIAARPVSDSAFGVAPKAQLACAMVIEGGNVVARVLAGMDWAVGLGVRVLSMSLGLRGYSEAFLTVTQILRARGVLPVFAVGNEGAGTSRSPGNYVEALSVGACDEQDGIPDFSSSQRFARENNPLVPDVVGPGVPGGDYAQMSGSSMATPHIAGLAALLLEARPAATPDEVEQAIFGSCERPDAMPQERANRGIPNAPRALQLLGVAPAENTGDDKGLQP